MRFWFGSSPPVVIALTYFSEQGGIQRLPERLLMFRGSSLPALSQTLAMQYWICVKVTGLWVSPLAALRQST